MVAGSSPAFGSKLMIYDQDGNIVSEAQPVIEKQYAVGKRSAADFGQWPFPYMVHPSSVGRLSYRMLREIYELSSSVRPAVDSIAREVANIDWKIFHRDKLYHPPAELEMIRSWLETPNIDRETLATVLNKFIVDLLVIGKAVIEKVRDSNGIIRELVPRDASLYVPKYDEWGICMGYVEFERHTLNKIYLHPKENIIYRNYTPITYQPSSVPIIETIVNEVALLMLGIKSIGWAFCNDEIPPGILAIGKIGQEALDRAKSSFEETRGKIGQGKMKVMDNVEGEVKWVELSRPFREMQVAELMPIIERIVARNFGLSPVESSLSDVARGVADISFKSTQSKLITPMMKLITEVLNVEVIRELNLNAEFMFVRPPTETFIQQVDGWVTLWEKGLASRNRALLALGQDPVEGGDRFSVLLGNEVVFLDPTTGEPQYRNPPGAPPPADQAAGQRTRQRPTTSRAFAASNPNSIVIELDPNQFEEVYDLDGNEELENAYHYGRRRTRMARRRRNS